MRQGQYLLLEDVLHLGRKGDIIKVKSPGYARNYLLPQKLAILATDKEVALVQRLREERAAQALVDKQEAEQIAQTLVQLSFEVAVKVDPEGHLYGSVSTQDIAHLLAEEGVVIDKHQIKLAHPIKELGTFIVPLKLKEGVEGSVTLVVSKKD